MSEPKEKSEAEKLIETLVERAGAIDHIFIAYSEKGNRDTILAGYSGHTPVMWTMGALNYVKWHLYDSLSRHKEEREIVEDAAVGIAEALKKEGLLN